jgi:hypothetical protein
MSQTSALSGTTDPQVPTQINTDSGSAIPISNELDVFGQNGIITSGSGKQITVSGINATAGADVGSTTIGVSSFDSANFTVTDGFVQLISGAASVTGLITDDGLPSVTPDGDGNIGIQGIQGIATAGQNGTNLVSVGLSNNAKQTAVHSWNGSLVFKGTETVASDGATVTISVQKDGGGDLTVVFSDGFYNWDTTPADTVALTAGLDTVPETNYIYMPQSTKVMTANTTGFPDEEILRIAVAIVPSASFVQTDGLYGIHQWLDDTHETDGQGHITDITYWIRSQHATWVSGVAQTYAITTNVGTPDNVIFTTTAGVILQLHPNSFPAFSGTPDIYVVNDPITPYLKITDINQIDTDALGATLVGRYYSLVIWGTVNHDTSNCKLFINLPSGSYSNLNGVLADSSGYANYTIPTDFKGFAFLISEWKLHQTGLSGGTWTSEDEIDLRGNFPSTIAGGGNSFQNQFVDTAFRIYDDGDTTKQIAFQADQISTATTRTITMANYNINLSSACISAPTDSGTATPASGALTFTGTGGIVTGGSGSTVTIDGTAIQDFNWNVATGATQALSVNNGYFANYNGTLAFTLPVTAAVGDTIEIVQMFAGQGWSLAQQTGQTCYIGNTNTTITTGTLASTDDGDWIQIVCRVADTDFQVNVKSGNITVT